MNGRPGNNLSFAAFGAMAVLAQVLVLRALLGRFGGNELLIGFGLFAWLILTGIVSALFGRLSDGIRDTELLVALCIGSIPISTAVGMAIAENGPALVGVAQGGAAPPHVAFLVSFLAVAPPAIPLGGLFALFVVALRRGFGASLRSVTLWEALGAAVGGLVFGTILIGVLGKAGIILSISVISVPPALYWLNRWKGKGPVFTCIFTLLLLGSGGYSFWLLARPVGEFQGLPVVARTENRHGLLTAVRDGDLVTIYQGFKPVVDCGDEKGPEAISVLSFGLRPRAGRILALGGALHSTGELVRPKGLYVRHVQQDPDLPGIEREYCGNPLDAGKNQAESIIGDPRLAVNAEDAASFDLVVVNGPDPDTVSAGRLMSAEFFAEWAEAFSAARGNRPEGLMLLGVGAPANYISPPVADLLASVLAAAKTAFSNCRFLPLDRYWLACTNGEIVSAPGTIADNALRAGLSPRFANRAWLMDKLSATRIDMIEKALADAGSAGVGANTDLHPIAPFFVLADWIGRFDAKAFRLTRTIRAYGMWLAAGLLALCLLPALASGLTLSRRWAALFVAAAVGSGGIAMEIIIMNAYQSGYGMLYERIGAMVAAYMAGLGLGAHLAERAAPEAGGGVRRAVFVSVLGFFAVQLMAFIILPLMAGGLPEILATFLAFCLLAVLAGFAGAAFQLAARVVKSEAEVDIPGGVAGAMRAVDHLAASLAVLFTGVLFAPVLGLTTAAAMAATLAGLAVLSWGLGMKMR